MQAERCPCCVPSISTVPFPMVATDVVYFGMVYLLLSLSRFLKFCFLGDDRCGITGYRGWKTSASQFEACCPSAWVAGRHGGLLSAQVDSTLCFSISLVVGLRRKIFKASGGCMHQTDHCRLTMATPRHL